MILATASHLTKNLEQHRDSQSIVHQADTIRASADLLEQIYTKLAAWAQVYHALRTVLDEGQKNTLRLQLLAIRQQLQESQTRFDNNEYAQRQKLVQVETRVERVIQETREYWSNYASIRLRTTNQWMAIARQWPSMRTELPRLQELYSDIIHRTQQLPTSVQEIDKFHRLVEELDDRLTKPKNLTQAQTRFLDKLQHDLATLNDLDPTLLAWCQQEGWAGSLKVRLGD